MKIAIFGGSGGTGKYVLRELIKNNYEINALARKPDSLNEFGSYEKLNVILGDALDKKTIDNVISGCDAVISVLGQRQNSPKDLLQRSISLIIESMKSLRVKRLVCLTGAGVYLEGDKPTFMDKAITFMIKLVAPGRFTDGEKMVQIIKKSELDWTIVRTQMQVDAEKGGKEAIGMVGSEGQTWRCSRGFLARFILRCIIDKSFIHETPKISD